MLPGSAYSQGAQEERNAALAKELPVYYWPYDKDLLVSRYRGKERGGAMKCIYDEYFTNGQECEKDLECDECEYREKVREILISIYPASGAKTYTKPFWE